MKFAALFLATFAVAVALPASELDFALVNQTGHDINALYLSASADRDWNENLLPNGAVIKAGARATVKFQAKPADARWDIRAVDENGTAVTFEQVNLLDAKQITLEAGTKTPSAVVE